MLDVSTKDALNRVDDQFVKVVKSCAAEDAPSTIEAAASTVVETIIDEGLERKIVEADLRDALRSVVVEPHTVKQIVERFVQTKAVMVPFASFVSSLTEKRTRDIERMQRKIKKKSRCTGIRTHLQNHQAMDLAARESRDGTAEQERTDKIGRHEAVRKVQSRNRQGNQPGKQLENQPLEQ